MSTHPLRLSAVSELSNAMQGAPAPANKYPKVSLPHSRLSAYHCRQGLKGIFKYIAWTPSWVRTVLRAFPFLPPSVAEFVKRPLRIFFQTKDYEIKFPRYRFADGEMIALIRTGHWMQIITSLIAGSLMPYRYAYKESWGFKFGGFRKGAGGVGQYMFQDPHGVGETAQHS